MNEDIDSVWKILFNDLPFEFMEPYGLRIASEPIGTLIPLYHQIIVPLRPTDKSRFRNIYGVSINEMFALIEQGRVIPLLSKGHDRYKSHFNFNIMTTIEKDETLHSTTNCKEASNQLPQSAGYDPSWRNKNL